LFQYEQKVEEEIDPIDEFDDFIIPAPIYNVKIAFHLHEQHTKLKEKWKEYQDLEMHYTAWELLNDS